MLLLICNFDQRMDKVRFQVCLDVEHVEDGDICIYNKYRDAEGL